MGLDGKWIVSRSRVKGSDMLRDRSVLSISGTAVKFMKADNTFTTLTVTITGDSFSNTAGSNGPYLSGKLVTVANVEILTGWVSNDSSKTNQDAFFAVRSPLEGNWQLFSVSSKGNAVLKDNSPLVVDGNSVTFSKAASGTETLNDVAIGADSMIKERASGELGYRLDAKVIHRGNLMFLTGTIGHGTGPGPHPLYGDNDTDTFTAVKVSPGEGS